MKCMERNKLSFYYSLYEGKEPIIDEYGNNTGEYTITYGKPIKARANISSAKGEMQTRQFGENEAYDKVLVLEDSEIDEYAVLWVDTLPEIKEDGTTDTPHDYIVTKVAKSLNSVSIAIRKVQVSG